MTDSSPLVAILMGSDSDWPVMKKGLDVLEELEIPSVVRVMSAHRTPGDAAEFASTAEERGFEVLIAGAGLAAHLAGAIAAHSNLPVIGVPIASGSLNGLDALLATVQMPPGTPVATVGIGRADNAALLAAQILARSRPDVAERLATRREGLREKVRRADEKLQAEL